MVKLTDKWFRIVGIALMWAASVYANKLYVPPFSFPVLLRALVTLASITLAWEGNRWIVLHLRKNGAEDAGWQRKIAVVFLSGWLYTGVLLFVTHMVQSSLQKGFSSTWADVAAQPPSFFISQFVTGPILLFTLIFVVYVALISRKELKASEMEKRRLEKEKHLSELENLNQQVNPHFLFNTLNALSSVVSENPAEADKLLNETSKVYRYLLDNNKHNLVTLQSELTFIRSFFGLLQLRYGAGIALSMADFNPEEEALLLPPLTLQLLVENAVKHNVHSKDRPLRIDIALTGGNRLTVANNLQRKPVKPVSHRIGLENIAAKYRLLQQPEPQICDDGQVFSVTVALLHPGLQASARPASTSG